VKKNDRTTYLEVQAHTGKVNERLDSSLSEFLGVTDTGTLEDKWRAESTAGNNNLLPGTEDAVLACLGRGQRLGGNCLDTDCAIALEDNLVDLGVALKEEIALVSHGAVNVGVGGVRSATCVTAVRCFSQLWNYSCERRERLT